MKHQSGFTLIELLLVLAIIGIISAIAIPALLGQREAAKRRATEATAQAVVSECSSGAKLMFNPTPAGVMAYVKALPNFTFPNCKNPYTNTTTSLVAAGPAVVDGDVGMEADKQKDINLEDHDVVKVSFKHKGVAAAQYLASVPAE